MAPGRTKRPSLDYLQIPRIGGQPCARHPDTHAAARKFVAIQENANFMKTSIDQYCINVTDLEKSLKFWEEALGLEITHRVETEAFTEVVLGGEDGNRIQLAHHHDQKGAIEHGNGFWKLYLKTDDCKGLYQRCIDAGAESVSAPERLEHWPVTAAFVLDPDGYTVEILEHHGETAALSGPAANG
jgi:lactoylglutathione lyase